MVSTQATLIRTYLKKAKVASISVLGHESNKDADRLVSKYPKEK